MTDDTVSKHFVTFYSPGTFFSETDSKTIDAWSTDLALRMADDITQRYNAKPYGFRFSTRSRGPGELDSKETARSGMYFLGGKVETLEEVKARATDDDRILISNMEGNGYKRIITNNNSWRATVPFEDDDTLLDYTPPAKRAKEAT